MAQDKDLYNAAAVASEGLRALSSIAEVITGNVEYVDPQLGSSSPTFNRSRLMEMYAGATKVQRQLLIDGIVQNFSGYPEYRDGILFEMKAITLSEIYR